MKKIERPMSTTVIDELPFHYCKTVEEVNNAFAGVKPEDVFMYRRTVDMETFQPQLMILVKTRSEMVSDWYKWVVPMELYVASDALQFLKEPTC